MNRAIEVKLKEAYTIRDDAKSVVDNQQKIINKLKSKLSSIKREEKRRLDIEKNKHKPLMKNTHVFKDEKLNITTQTKDFVKRYLFPNSHDDISIRLLSLWLEEEGEKEIRFKRMAFIINKRSEGVGGQGIADALGITHKRVYGILQDAFKILKHPVILRKITIKDR